MKQEVKALLESGALNILEKVEQKILSEMEAPGYEGDKDKLIHEMGMYEGRKDGMRLLLETLESLAKS